MKISTKGHYGLRSLIDVALNQDGGPVTLNDIAQRQSISVKYLWQVINPLRTSGFLRVTRGAKGGYMLARPPHEINILDVLTALEGPVSLLKCLTDETVCTRTATCVARTVWVEANEAIETAFSHITLEKLVNKQKLASQTANYSI
jgi:Rrf2 family protein